MHPNDAQIVTSDHSGKLSVWDLVADKCSLELLPERASGAPLADVAVSSNGQYMVALGNSGMLYKYTMAQASSAVKGVLGEPQSVKAHDRYGLSVTISPDSKLIATTSADHSIKLWGAADLALERTLTGHSKWVWRSVFSADSAYLVSCSSDASARLWDVSTGDCVRSYVGHQKPCVALAMNDE
jgi:G protein beta subunit-like protein